jgi:hypothetical protein
MNERLTALYRASRPKEALVSQDEFKSANVLLGSDVEKFAKLLIEDVLNEVKERAYYTGDRDWSDDVDRQWIQLEFGYGPLHDAKQNGVKDD